LIQTRNRYETDRNADTRERDGPQGNPPRAAAPNMEVSIESDSLRRSNVLSKTPRHQIKHTMRSHQTHSFEGMIL
jgi:hypothetical protein